MTENISLQKIEILLQQKKYAEAEEILKNLLSQDVRNTQYLQLLAEVNLQQDRYDNAMQIIDNAITIEPDSSDLFYIKSRIFLMQEKYDKAEEYIKTAISIYSYDADYFAFLAFIQLSRKQYAQALETADNALKIDSENLLALNTRSNALLKLNKPEDSFATIEGALREDPNSAYTHANYGWNLLEKGNHKKALEHFREALKNNPNYDYAQAGMIESLKASNAVYRLFLKYSFWMGNLTAKYQWAVIIGFYLGVKFLRGLAYKNPAWQPYLLPVIILLTVFAFSTWIIAPVSNLFLRFNKYGNLLLSKNEKTSSNAVALSLFVALVGLALFIFIQDIKYLGIVIFGIAMMIPFSTMFAVTKYKNLPLYYAFIMTGIGISAIITTFMTNNLYNMMSIIFLFGIIAYQWIANYILIADDNK